MTKGVSCRLCGSTIKERVEIWVNIKVNGSDFDSFTAVKGQLHFTTLPSGHELETMIQDSRRITR